MSTFTNDNGPYEGVNYILFRKYIDQLRADLNALAAKLPSGQFDTTKTIRSEIDKVAVQIPPLQSALTALDTAITTQQLTVQKGVDKILEISDSVFKIHHDLEAANIDVKKIEAGPSLIFDKYHPVSIMGGVGSIPGGSYTDYYVLAELKRVATGPTNMPTITLPCTLYVYNDADPKVSAVIYATEGGIAVLHCGRDFPNPPPVPPAPTPPPPRVSYVVVRTGQDDSNFHYYVCMVIYKQNQTHVALAATALRVAMINAMPVTAPIQGVGIQASPEVTTSQASDFLITHLSIADLEVDNLTVNAHATFKGTTDFKAGIDVTNGGARITGDTVIDGNLHTKGNTQTDGTLLQKGATTFNESVIMDKNLKVTGAIDYSGSLEKLNSVAALHIETPDVIHAPGMFTLDGRNIIFNGGNSTIVGEANSDLKLRGKADRPTYNTKDMALLNDLAHSIVYKGKFEMFDYVAPSITGSIPISADGKTTPIGNGWRCLVITKPYTNIAQIYTYSTSTTPNRWIATGTIPLPVNDQAFQFHVDWVKEADDIIEDKFYHEADIIWHPSDSVENQRLSIINLPLEDYYTKEQIEHIVSTWYDLSTRQADWLVEDRIATVYDPDGNPVAVDNPAYIRNRPITGLSILDGGVFPDPIDSIYPQWYVDGGDFSKYGARIGQYPTEDDLPTEMRTGETWYVDDYAEVEHDLSGTGEAARYKISAVNGRQVFWARDVTITSIGNLRKEVIFKLWSGLKKDLPEWAQKTKNTLKWCVDTRELFVDMYGEQEKTPGEFVKGNKLISESMTGATISNLALALGPIDVSWDSIPKTLSYSIIETITKSGSPDVTWTLASTPIAAEDNRIAFGRATALNAENIKLVLRITDVLAMTNSGTDELNPLDDITNNTASMKWIQKTRGTIDKPNPAMENRGFALEGGNGLSISKSPSSVTNNLVARIDLNSSVTDPLENVPVVRSIATTTTNGAKVAFTSNSLQNTLIDSVKSFAVTASNGIAVTATGTDDLVAAVSLDPTIYSALTARSMLADVVLSPTATRVTFRSDTIVGTGYVTKSFGVQALSNAGIIVNPVGDATNLVAEISLDPQITNTISTLSSALSTDIVYAAAIANNTLSMTINHMLDPSATPVIKELAFAADVGLALNSAVVNDKTTLTYSLDSTTADKTVTRPVGIDASTGLILTFTSEPIAGTAPSVQKTASIIAGTGITLTNKGTATDPIVEIANSSIVPSPYDTITLTDSGVQCSYVWSKCGYVVNVQLYLVNASVGAASGTFTDLLPDAIRPMTDVKFMIVGPSGYRSISIHPTGAVDYQVDEGPAGFNTSITYFVGA